MTGETPPAAKGVTKAMVEAAYDAFTRSFASSPIGTNNTRNDLRAAILAALSLPAPREGEAREIALGEDGTPERIWAGDFDAQGFGHCVAGMQGGLYAEYVRVDLSTPVMADDLHLIEELRRIAKVGFGYDIANHDRVALNRAADTIEKYSRGSGAR